jgi:hypothetical protein
MDFWFLLFLSIFLTVGGMLLNYALDQGWIK